MHVELRPPLPSLLQYRDTPFVVPAAPSRGVSPEAIVALACALHEILPAGDFTRGADGRLTYHSGPSGSVWYRQGLVESLERSVDL